MGRKQLAAVAAPMFITLLCAATPSVAFDNLSQQSPGVMFYFSLPLDARNAKEQVPAAGFAIQGKRQYETVYVDSRMFNFTGTGIEAKWIIAGVVAAGAAVAVASKDKSTTSSYQEQQQAQQAQAAQQQQQQAQQGGGSEPCPVTPNCP